MLQTYVCPQCGKPFERNPDSVRVDEPCCSKSCAWKRISQPTEQGECNRRAILESIKTFTEKNGYPPSVREITKDVGLGSISTASYHLKRLEKDGLLSHTKGTARSWHVIPKDEPEKDQCEPA